MAKAWNFDLDDVKFHQGLFCYTLDLATELPYLACIKIQEFQVGLSFTKNSVRILAADLDFEALSAFGYHKEFPE